MGMPIETTISTELKPSIMNVPSGLDNHQIITYKLLRVIGESLQPENVAYQAVEKVHELTGWSTVALLSANEDGLLVIRASIGSMLTDIGINGRAFRTGYTQHVTNLIGDSDIGPTYQKTYSALAIPITRYRRQLGVFNVEKEHPFSPDDMLLAESMAEVIALALDHAELHAQAQRRLRAQTALQQAISTISFSLELPTVFTRIADQMCQALNVTSSYVYSYQSQSNGCRLLAKQLSAAANASEQTADLSMMEEMPPVFLMDVAALQAGTPLVYQLNSLELLPVRRNHMLRHGVQTLLIVPLQISQETIAFVELWESRYARVFFEDDLALGQGIAQHAALAIENARLFQKIEEEHGRFQALIEANKDGIVMIDMNGRILLINEPATTLLHLPDGPAKWVGATADQLIQLIRRNSPPAAKMMQIELNRINTGDEKPGEGEVEIPPYFLHWRNLPVITDNQLIGRVVLLRDITQQRSLERMRDDLTHTMVHDLRGPLTSILLSLEVLQMLDQLPADLVERRTNAVTRAYSSTQKLLRLVEDILELSRLESGWLPLNLQSISLMDIVNNVIDIELPVARDKKITLVNQLSPILPFVQVDRGLMERVLQNLVENAVKFTPPGGEVTVTANLSPHDDQLLWITVCDTGGGVPREVQEHLFQKFTRGVQVERGSGLGLYFCKMVVEAHNGRIWLAQTDQTGTTIQFSLPITH